MMLLDSLLQLLQTAPFLPRQTPLLRERFGELQYLDAVERLLQNYELIRVPEPLPHLLPGVV